MADSAAESQPLTGSQDAEKRDVLQPFTVEDEEKAPTDVWSIVYCIVLFHGIGTLLPWNAFMTIGPDYYTNYKMKAIENGTSVPTSYSENFMHYQLIAAQAPNLLFNFANIFAASYFRMDILKTVCGSLSVVASMLVITMYYIYQNTWEYMSLFFWITIATIVVLNAANGLYQNCIFGVASELPFRYTNAVIIGNNICGTFVSVVAILTANLSNDVKFNAMTFFGVAFLSLVICFISIFFLRKQEFFLHYSRKAELNREEEVARHGRPGVRDYISTFKEGAPQFANVFTVFFVTLTVFPGLMVTVSPNSKGEAYDFWIPEKLFVSVTTFLLFNVFSFIGSLLAGVKQMPSAKKLWIPVFLRLLFIPFFIFCNCRPETRTLPVLFDNVYIYLFGAMLMSTTNGYYSGMSMMYANTTVAPSKQRVAGTMAAFFLILGILSGVLFSLFLGSLI